MDFSTIDLITQGRCRFRGLARNAPNFSVHLPVIFGLGYGDDGRPLLAGPGAPIMADLRRGRFAAVTPLGDDLRIDLVLDAG